MSGSLAYGLGAGGIDRWDKEVNVDAIKKGVAPLLKKNTYTEPLKRISWPKRGSKSRGNSIETPTEQSNTSQTTATTATDILHPDKAHEHAPVPLATTESTKASSQSQVSYHALDSTSPLPHLSAILSLSNSIFSADPDSTKYSSLDTWQSNLSMPNSIMFFARIASPETEADVQPIGFIHAFPRSPTDYTLQVRDELIKQEVQEVLHIWLCGVLPQYRGRGVFSQLMRLVEGHAREKGFGNLSVATFPKRFGRMYDTLMKRGWVVMNDEYIWSEGTGKVDEGKVVLMKDVAMEVEIGVAK